MKLVDILDREGVIPALNGRDKRAVLDEIAAAVAKRTNGTLSAETMSARLMERENGGSTAMGFGVAVPHGKAPLAKMIAVFARTAEGVEFGALDKRPCQLFFGLAIPETQPGCHLAALARIARLLKSEAFRQRLLTAPDGDSLWEAIREEDART